MKLIALLRTANEWDDDATIYVAQPWTCDADAILVTPAPVSNASVERDGTAYDYFLETFVAREFMEDLGRSEEGSDASEAARCERLISYAENDA